jgi:hypothetical protein
MKLRTLLLTTLLLCSTAVVAADLTGTWQITISGTSPDGTVQKDTGLAVLQQNGDGLTGSLGPDETRLSPISEGSIKDNKIILKASPRPDRTMTFELTVSGEKLVGTVSRTGDNRTATVEFVRSVKK